MGIKKGEYRYNEDNGDFDLGIIGNLNLWG